MLFHVFLQIKIGGTEFVVKTNVCNKFKYKFVHKSCTLEKITLSEKSVKKSLLCNKTLNLNGFYSQNLFKCWFKISWKLCIKEIFFHFIFICNLASLFRNKIYRIKFVIQKANKIISHLLHLILVFYFFWRLSSNRKHCKLN